MWQACTVVCLSKLSSLSHPRLRKVLCLSLVCMAGQQRESYCFWACKSFLLPSRSKGALLDSWLLLSVLAALNLQRRSPSSSQRRAFGLELMSCMPNYLQMLLENCWFYAIKVNSYNSAASSDTKNTQNKYPQISHCPSKSDITLSAFISTDNLLILTLAS